MIFAHSKNYKMKNILLLLLTGLIIISCDSTTENTMLVSGNVKGLKKGTIYLQKIQDTTLVTVDSVQMSGDSNFSLTTELESPEIYYLYLDKADNSEFNDRITFFAEPGVITINTSWNTFATKVEISGSETQKKYEEFQKNISKFNTLGITLAQKVELPEIMGNKKAVDSITTLLNKNNLRTYLYALNYSLHHKNSYIAPYLALTEVPDANVIYLDSIYNSLSVEVSNSKYGKKLKEHIASVKAEK